MKKRAFFNRLVFDFIYLDGIERSLCDLGLLQNSQPKIMHKKPAAKEVFGLLLRPVLVVGCCFFCAGYYCVFILQRAQPCRR